MPESGIVAGGQTELAVLLGNTPGTVGYARTILRSSTQQPVRLWFGSDDPCRVFLNGELIHSQAGSAERDKGADKVAINTELREGDNLLLVKVLRTSHGMGYYLRLEEPEHEVTCGSDPAGEFFPAGFRVAEAEEWDGLGDGQT